MPGRPFFFCGGGENGGAGEKAALARGVPKSL